MRYKLNYAFQEHHIASLAKTPEILGEMLALSYHVASLEGENLVFYPEGWIIGLDENAKEAFASAEEFSIFEFYKGEAFLVCDIASSDPALFVTNRCNSNCIMCPVSSKVRRHDSIAGISVLLNICRQIPEDVHHITITGGEPFFLKEDLFVLLNWLKINRNHTEYLLLTNGRAFSRKEYAFQFHETVPDNFMVGIPVHGHNSAVHDSITRTPGSFVQTVRGIYHLLNWHAKIEIRIVVSKQNIDCLCETAEYLSQHFPGIRYVTFIGLEMLGNAWLNRNDVWVDYRHSFTKMKPAILLLVRSGIDVRIYNYPLCCVEKAFWPICAKSITDYKISYSNECENCKVKDACGGLFQGTYQLMKDRIHAVAQVE